MSLLKIILIVVHILLLLLIFLPMGLSFSFSHGDGKNRGYLRVHPFLLSKFGAVTVLGEGKKKKKPKKKRKKAKGQESKKKKKKKPQREREMMPVPELILHLIDLVGKTKRRLKLVTVDISFAYGFPDPATTGKVTGAIYGVLPPLRGEQRKSRWRWRFYPQWCTEETAVAVEGSARASFFTLCVAFLPLLPDIIKLLPKRKKKREVTP